MKFSFQLWHLFLASAVVATGLWAWSHAGLGGVALVGAWGCAVASELIRHRPETRNTKTERRSVRWWIRMFNLGLLTSFGYWLFFHALN